MRILAQWVPTTPEMEAKVLFGRHVWDCARHADAFGKRAFEMRAPLNYMLPPTDAYRGFLDDVAALEPAANRIAAFYDVVLAALAEHYGRYLEGTDDLMDEPTVRILEGALRDLERMRAERFRLLEGVTLSATTIDVAGWRSRERGLGAFVLHGGEGGPARGVQP